MKIRKEMKQINWADHFVQMIFIFSSVLFAFWLSDRSEKNKLKETELIAIASVHSEMQLNLNGIIKAGAYHKEKLFKLFDILTDLEDEQIIQNQWSASHIMDSVFNRRSNSLGLYPLKEAAYQTFIKSNANLQVDYELAQLLAEVYQLQNEAVKQTALRLTDNISGSKDFYDYKESSSMIVLCFYTVRELYGQELYLAQRLEEVICRIEEAYPSTDLSIYK